MHRFCATYASLIHHFFVFDTQGILEALWREKLDQKHQPWKEQHTPLPEGEDVKYNMQNACLTEMQGKPFISILPGLILLTHGYRDLLSMNERQTVSGVRVAAC
jgi:hypothetical protein